MMRQPLGPMPCPATYSIPSPPLITPPPACVPHAQVMSDLGIKTVGQLAATPLQRLEAAFGDKDALWLYALARGVVTGGWA